MKPARTRSTAATATAVLAVMSLATACNRDGSDAAGPGSDKPAIGIDLPRSDSDFWNSYAQYLKKDIETDGVNALPLSNSQNDVTKLVANVQVFQNRAPRPSSWPRRTPAPSPPPSRPSRRRRSPWSASTPGPTRATSTWWSAPTTGPTAPRPANTSASKLGGKGRVAELQGDLRLHQRTRPLRGLRRLHEGEVPEDHSASSWPPTGRARWPPPSCRACSPSTSDIERHLHAGRRRLPAADPGPAGAEEAAQAGRVSRATSPIISNDGIPQELAAIRDGPDRRHPLPARRPLRQVRAVLRQGRGLDGQDLPARARPTTAPPS